MNRLLAPIILLAVLLGVWETACRMGDVPVYLLPPPSAVAAALIDRAPLLLASAWNTLWMALQALFVATLVGGGLAVAVSLSRMAEAAARPLAVTLQVTPVVALAPSTVLDFQHA